MSGERELYNKVRLYNTYQKVTVHFILKYHNTNMWNVRTVSDEHDWYVRYEPVVTQTPGYSYHTQSRCGDQTDGWEVEKEVEIEIRIEVVQEVK